MNDARHLSLTNVGFTEKEAQIFTALSELGEGTASQIAKRAQLKRPIVYLILEKLVKQGTVLEIPKQRIKRYASIEPTKLIRVLESNVEQLRTMLPLFRAFQRKGDKKPQVEMFETKEGIASVYRMLQEAKVSRFLSTYSRLKEFFPEEVERWGARGADVKYKNTSRRLCPDESEAKKLAAIMRENKTQLFRFLPKQTKLAMDFSICDDLLVITSFDPLFCLAIRSQDLANSAAVLFDLAWEKQRGTK